MKKLMIMAAIASAAVAAQATAWFGLQSSDMEEIGTLYNGKDSSSTALGNHSIYMLVEDGMGLYTDWAELAGQVVSAFQNGELSESNIKNYSSYVATLTTEFNGRIDAAQTFEYANGEFGEWNGFLAVAFNGNSIYIGNMIRAPGVDEEPTAAVNPMSIGFISSDYDFGNSGFTEAPGWYSVPEPTSGVLMLLGLAGLALKRKRA